MIIITVCLIVIIGSIVDSSITSSQAFKLGKILRIFRLFLMFRKMTIIRKYKDKIVKKKDIAVNLTSPSEKIIEILNGILELEWISYQTVLKADIKWCINMIKEQKIYQTNVRAVKEELRDLVNWAVNQNQFEGDNEEETPIKVETFINTVTAEKFGSEIELILNDVHTWDFDIFALEKASPGRCLEIVTSHIFATYNLYQTLSLDSLKFINFIRAVQLGYHAENPYHNSIHAADVVQSFYYFLHTCQAIEIASLADFEIIICLISAAVHDYDHPGVNNIFLINTSSPLAMLYNDKSVLENHHVASSFKLLLQENQNFIENFSKDDKKKFRIKMISLVLATDFARHFMDLGKFQLKFTSSNAAVKDDEDRMLVMEMLMHASDVGNPSRPWNVCYEWATRVMNEFFAQGDKERDMGLQISNLCDRHSVSIPKSQIGFTELFIEPTFNMLEPLFPSVSENIRNISENKQKWKDALDSGKPNYS